MSYIVRLIFLFFKEPIILDIYDVMISLTIYGESHNHCYKLKVIDHAIYRGTAWVISKILSKCLIEKTTTTVQRSIYRIIIRKPIIIRKFFLKN